MRFPLFSWLLLFYSISVLFATDHILLVCGRCLDDQRDLLLQLHQSLSFNDYRPTDSKLASWNKSTDCCGWKGVTCDGVSGRITGLDLSSEYIAGGIGSLFNLRYLQSLNLASNDFDMPTPIPSEIVKLVDLTHLNLSNNTGFYGQVPIEISHLTRLVSLDLSANGMLILEKPNLITLVQNLSELRILCLDEVDISPNGNQWGWALSSSLPNLRVLSLSGNNLTGPIPSLPKTLTHLNLGYNSLTGSLPDSLSKMLQLDSLDLSGNNLTGLIPPLPESLTHLDLASNSLTGRLPDSLQKMLQLDSLDLSGNNLTGPIPPLPESLTHLDLASNSLTGPLPNSLQKMLQLDSLDLSGNNLTGPIPPLPESLTHLDLSNNSLTGPLPDSLQKMLQLDSLDLSGNSLTGPIPPLPENLTQINLAQNSLTGSLGDSFWKRLVKLVNLDLTHNFLNGTIPSFLFTLPTLKSLQLGQNQFDGQIMEFSSTSSLDVLDLSSNKLEGPIPLSIFQLKQLVVLVLSSNNFNGTIELGMIQKLQMLLVLDLSYNSLLINTIVHNSNSSFPQFVALKLASCKLRCFPDFLKQNQSSFTVLDLSNNQIHGQIPSWVWKIGDGSLQYLNLSFNFLNNLGQPLPDLSNSALAFLDLHSNLLQGPIPTLSSNLIYLDFSHNSFQSIIPSNLIDSTSLTFFLSLSSNNLTGEIPQSICNAGLEVLDLSNNRLSGTIPSCLGNMNKTLKTLNLSGNKLRGPLPKDLAQCTKLQVINLGNNQINGPFPFWLGSCTDLRVLVLRSNRFDGPIKGDSMNYTFSKLQILDLSWNNFTGNLPPKFFEKWAAMKADENETQSMIKAEPLRVNFQLQKSDPSYISYDFLGLETIPEVFFPSLGVTSQVYYQDTVVVSIKGRELELTKILTTYFCVDLSNNGFQGEIPGGIGNLTALYVLNLSQNALTGPIPSSLGKLKQLESLDLSCNKLQGEIPQQLTSLTFLEFLNLSVNDLTGRIPKGNQFDTFLNTSYVGNEGLCGTPLSRNCREIIPAALPPIESSSKKRQLFGYDWEFVLSGFIAGFGGGAGIVMAFFLFSDRGRKWLLAQTRS